MRVIKGGPIVWMLAMVPALAGCSHPRPMAIPTPWRDAPVSQDVADAIQTGMTHEQVKALAGAPRAGGGVSDAPNPPFHAGQYSVATTWPPGNRDWTNTTWIYLIRGTAPVPVADERYLFVEIEDGVATRAYQGTVVSWSMN